MNKNTKVRVLETNKFHASKIGYFQFLGEGLSDGVAVLAKEPTKPGELATLFAVGENEIQEVE